MKPKGIGKGNNPNSKKALTKRVKGAPPVPGAGRPKGSLSLKERLSKFSNIEIPVKMPNGTVENQTIIDSIILSLLAQAQKGNLFAIKEVLDRHFGKEPEKLDIEDNELRITVNELKGSLDLLKRNEKPY